MLTNFYQTKKKKAKRENFSMKTPSKRKTFSSRWKQTKRRNSQPRLLVSCSRRRSQTLLRKKLLLLYFEDAKKAFHIKNQ